MKIKIKKGLLFIPASTWSQRFEHTMKTRGSQFERHENVVESLRTPNKRPHIINNRKVNTLQPQHENCAIATIVVQTPTYWCFFSS
jgi:hypothetical protein